VRDLFRRYPTSAVSRSSKVILYQENSPVPIRMDGYGKVTLGGLISRGHLYKILSNPIYLGG
jgi:hypothetical protein